MNVTSPLATPFRIGAMAQPQIALPDSREFSSRLSIGQIIKGRVLLHYEDNRYLVAFDGKERTVDSSVPLRTGDLLRGRVIALGDRVELQYLPEDGGEGALSAGKGRATEPLVPSPDRASDVNALFVRYQAKLSADGRDLLLHAMKSASDREFVALAGLTVAKLGMPQSLQILQAVAAALARVPANEPISSRVDTRSAILAPGLANQLRELVRQALSEPENILDDSSVQPRPVPELPIAEAKGGQTNADGSNPQSGGLAGSSVLNAQSGGSVAHRIGTLPLIVGNRLIEVDIAVFEHEREKSGQSGTQHRALVFVLNLSKLGRVEVSATVVENRLRIRIGADRTDTASALSHQAEALRVVLTQAGWSVDEVTYETRDGDRANPAVRAVVEHVISQESVNRLV